MEGELSANSLVAKYPSPFLCTFGRRPDVVSLINRELESFATVAGNRYIGDFTWMRKARLLFYIRDDARTRRTLNAHAETHLALINYIVISSFKSPRSAFVGTARSSLIRNVEPERRLQAVNGA